MEEGKVFWTGWKNSPCPCTQSLGVCEGYGSNNSLPKNKRAKMTVEDTVTKSSSGQIGGSMLWRVSHKRWTTQPPSSPLPTLLSLRSGSHYRRGRAAERAGGVWKGCQKPLVCVRPGRRAAGQRTTAAPAWADNSLPVGGVQVKNESTDCISTILTCSDFIKRDPLFTFWRITTVAVNVIDLPAVEVFLSGLKWGSDLGTLHWNVLIWTPALRFPSLRGTCWSC